MKNNLEDLTIADLKALYDYSLYNSDNLLTFISSKEGFESYDYWTQVFTSVKTELNKRVEHIFGKQ